MAIIIVISAHDKHRLQNFNKYNPDVRSPANADVCTQSSHLCHRNASLRTHVEAIFAKTDPSAYILSTHFTDDSLVSAANCRHTRRLRAMSWIGKKYKMFCHISSGSAPSIVSALFGQAGCYNANTPSKLSFFRHLVTSANQVLSRFN